MPRGEPSLGDVEATIEKVLTMSRVIALVGLSDNEERPSNRVARYLQSVGYRIVPVNPMLKGPVLGEHPFPSLEDVPDDVDLVDIFRRSSEVPPVVEAAIRMGTPAVWMQLGVIHEGAALLARAAGLDVVMDRCTAIEHRRLARLGKLQSE
jgi:predicted CoA-binding protein